LHHNLHSISGILVQGHQVASGASTCSPYPAGTIKLQKPYFRELGLDLSACFDGTLNVAIEAKSFQILRADYYFENLRWVDDFNPETFSLVACQLEFASIRYAAWVYYPHPETKTKHFQQPNLVEVLAPKISGIKYGDKLRLHFDATKFKVEK
jgi:hypothetical protein